MSKMKVLRLMTTLKAAEVLITSSVVLAPGEVTTTDSL